MENIEAATARWGAVRLMDILRQDLRGNMINLMPESENFSRKGHQFRIHSIDTQYTNTKFHIYFSVHWSLSRVITCLEAVKGGIFASSKEILGSDSF